MIQQKNQHFIRTKTFAFNDPKPYDKIEIEDSNIIEILYAMDSDGNKWYHVPFLAQDTIFEPTPNISRNDRQLSTYREETPYLLKLRKVSRRFSTRQLDNGKIEIQFGAGVSELDDELLVPNPDLVGSKLAGIETITSLDIDPSNFLYTKTYGLAPNNTDLTFYYTVGGGIRDNVPSETITRLKTRSILIDETGLDLVLYGQVVGSLAVINSEPASGGKEGETVDEIRQNALASFASQNRAVTKEDYIIRAYSLPQKYGSIAKAYITKDDQLTKESIYNSDRIVNPLALNFYVLGYDSNSNLTKINNATKENLKTYLGYHRMLTDAINIKDAYIINLQVEFDIITMPDQNGNQVILRCIDRLKKYFDIKRWQINQPIVISNVFTELDKVEGVQTVVDVKFINVFDTTVGYSGNAYNISNATRDGVIFPSLDPSIFEIRYPDNDIIGRVRAFG
jgi:phage-related baseplate assembly protein